jgi:hypothetical protein
MPAPVYRHLDVRGALFGISVLEWAPLLFAAWFGMVLDHPNQGVLVAAVLYVCLRVLGHGRPEGFLRHTIAWRRRRASSGGRLSAAARARSPQFPLAEYESVGEWTRTEAGRAAASADARGCEP